MNLKHFLCVFSLLAAALVAHAQPRDRDRNDGREWGRGRDDDHRRRARVIVFEHADYRGRSIVLYPGDTFENLAQVSFEGGARLNDRISSIRIEGGAELYVYADSHYRGAAMRLTESVRDLTGRVLPGGVSASWNDRISALRVEARRRDVPRVDADVVVRRAYLDLLGREPDPSGLGHFRSLILDQGWTEGMVRDNIRRGDEYRREGADRIIRRAYLDVLGREVDPEGLRHFRHQLLERNWTEDDVRNDLRGSDEYRRKNGRR